jgi:hypothetical protein
LSTKEITERPEMKRHEYLWYIAQRMLDFKDTTNDSEDGEEGTTTVDPSMSALSEGHISIQYRNKNAKCAVCKLDYNIQKLALKDTDDEEMKKDVLHQASRFMGKQLSICTKCNIVTHPTRPPVTRHIHNIDAFKGMSCFQIAHSKDGYNVWIRGNGNERTIHK